jgi:hypothetical protein
MRILRDSIDTANSFSEKRSIPRQFDAHRCTLAKLSTAIGCNKDAGSSLRCILRDSFNTADSFFGETVGSKTLRGAQMYFIIFQRAIGCNRDARSS